MKGYLLDTNVLLALAWPNHVQHPAAHEWFDRHAVEGWGTCSLTQLGFVRISSHPAFDFHVSTQEALEKLREIIAFPGHVFWPEAPGGYAHASLGRTLPRTLTHGMVTDAFLAGIAAFHGGKLATFDQPLARAFADCCAPIGPG